MSIVTKKKSQIISVLASVICKLNLYYSKPQNENGNEYERQRATNRFWTFAVGANFAFTSRSLFVLGGPALIPV